MSFIKKIVALINHHPKILFEEHESSIEIHAHGKNGFSVGASISSSGLNYTVAFDEGFRGFIVEESAIDFIRLLLSTKCRLKISHQILLKVNHRWVVQKQEHNKWKTVYVSGFSLFDIFCYWTNYRTLIERNMVF